MSVKCNRCGTVFDSPFCPNCGVKAEPKTNIPGYIPTEPKKKKQMSTLSIVLLCVFGGLAMMIFLIEIGLYSDYTISTLSNKGYQHITSTPTPELKYIQITSTELIALYKNNQVKCKQDYNDKLLEVTGKIDSIGTDILDHEYVCLGSDDQLTIVGIQCYAKDKEVVDEIAKLNKGDTITVKGKGNCGSLSFSIEKAVIVK